MKTRAFALAAALLVAAPIVPLWAADTGAVTWYLNDGAAHPISGLNYTSGFMTVNFVGFTFCQAFTGSGNPTTNVSFLPQHGSFYGSFNVNGITGFQYVGLPGNTAQARMNACPLGTSGQQDARCNGFKVSCLSMDSDGTRAGDEKHIFSSGFDEHIAGSYVTLVSVVRPTSANPNLVVTVDYHLPGSASGLPAQSYAANFTFDAAILGCPFGSETLFATTAPQVIHRTYSCQVPFAIPPAGTPLAVAMLFMAPGDASYHPAFDSASDNMVLVKM